MNLTTVIGLTAAVCTTVSYFPQLKKCWDTGSAGDLSLKMFLTLAAGVALWAVYGFLRADVVIIVANAISFALLMGILYFKLRERHSASGTEYSIDGSATRAMRASPQEVKNNLFGSADDIQTILDPKHAASDCPRGHRAP